MQCPDCGATNPEGTAYCANCGTALSATGGSTQDGSTCGSCGADNPPDAQFCNACGAHLGGKQPADRPPRTGQGRAGQPADQRPGTGQGGAGQPASQPPRTGQGGAGQPTAGPGEPAPAGGHRAPAQETDEQVPSALKWWGGLSYAIGALAGLVSVLLVVVGRFILEFSDPQPAGYYYYGQPTGPSPLESAAALGIAIVVLIGFALVWMLHGYFIRRGSVAAWIGGMVWYGLSFLGSLVTLNPVGLVIFAAGLVLGVMGRDVVT